MRRNMDVKLFASFSVICILLQCCQICESRPRASSRCKGLFKGPNCPSSNISFTKRLLDEIMKRTDNGEVSDNREWEDQLRTVDDPEFNDGETFADRSPSNDWGQPGQEQADTKFDARAQAEEELRIKELKLLFVRALLDDLENETFDDI